LDKNIKVVQHQNGTTSKWYNIKVIQHQNGTTSKWYNIKMVQHQNGTTSKWYNIPFIFTGRWRCAFIVLYPLRSMKDKMTACNYK